MILTTKLFVPRLRQQIVSRQRLLDRLDNGLSGKVILVSAPAGFGKTTLLTEWLAVSSHFAHSHVNALHNTTTDTVDDAGSNRVDTGQSPRYQCAWVALDEHDNEDRPRGRR